MIHSDLFDLLLCTVKQAQQILQSHGIELNDYQLQKQFNLIRFGRTIRIRLRELAEFIEVENEKNSDRLGHNSLQQLCDSVYYVPLPIVRIIDKFLSKQELDLDLNKYGSYYWWEGTSKELISHLQVLPDVDNLIQLLPTTAYGLTAMLNSHASLLLAHGILVDVNENTDRDQSKRFTLKHVLPKIDNETYFSINELMFITCLSDSFIHGNFNLDEFKQLPYITLKKLILEKELSAEEIQVDKESEKLTEQVSLGIDQEISTAHLLNMIDAGIANKAYTLEIVNLNQLKPKLETAKEHIDKSLDESVNPILISIEDASKELQIPLSDLYALAFQNASLVQKQDGKLLFIKYRLLEVLPKFISKHDLAFLILKLFDPLHALTLKDGNNLVDILISILSLPVKVIHNKVADNNGIYSVEETISNIDLTLLIEKLTLLLEKLKLL